jgi:hypothetical protein
MKGGRYFLRERPATATSWRNPVVVTFAKHSDVETTIMRVCQYGMLSRGPDGQVGPVYKPTAWMSNSPAVLSRLTRKCSRGLHQHVHLIGGRAAKAAVNPANLCLQILKGIRDQVRRDEATNKESCISSVISSLELEEEIMVTEPEVSAGDWVQDDTRFCDDITREELDRDLVVAGRAE